LPKEKVFIYFNVISSRSWGALGLMTKFVLSGVPRKEHFKLFKNISGCFIRQRKIRHFNAISLLCLNEPGQ